MMLRYIPNAITIIRLLLVVPIVYYFLTQKFEIALLLFIIAGVSDALDGYLARRNNWFSTLGSILDPIADKLLMISSFICLLYVQAIPVWLFSAVLVRDIFIVGGATAFYFLIGRYEMAPSVISKINTAVQVLYVTVVMLSLTFIDIPASVMDILAYVLFITVILSGVGYIYHWSKKAIHSDSNMKSTQ